MNPYNQLDPRHSYSAPKKFKSRDNPVFDFSNSNISPGVSPSLYVVENIPIDHSSQKQHQNVFFNSAIPIPELKILGDIDAIYEESDEEHDAIISWEINRKRYDQWISKSCSSVPSDPTKFHEELKKIRVPKVVDPLPLQHTPPPPGFGISKPEESKRKFNWADLSSDSDFTPTPVSTLKKPEKVVKNIEIEQKSVILKSLPQKVSLVKREKRGTFNQEEVIEKKFTGKLKFYQLKKRFGFITLDEDQADIFLCEDDLLLSGINHKKFKENVINKEPINFKFFIKKYIEKGRDKRKAIDIEVVDCKQ